MGDRGNNKGRGGVVGGKGKRSWGWGRGEGDREAGGRGELTVLVHMKICTA